MHFTFPQPGPNHSKFNRKMQDFKRVLDLNCKTEQLNFFNWLSNYSEYVQNVIQWYWNSFFFQKITKNRPEPGASPSDPLASGGWGLRPQTPVCDTFELQCTSLLKHVSQFRYFCTLTLGVSPVP